MANESHCPKCGAGFEQGYCPQCDWGEYTHADANACIEAKDHGTNTDPDGYCNYCGQQE